MQFQQITPPRVCLPMSKWVGMAKPLLNPEDKIIQFIPVTFKILKSATTRLI